MQHDIAIVGAGPVGLCLARALAMQGLKVALVERQPQEALADPAFDGREIALTHASIRLLRELGVWPHIPDGEIHPMHAARVMDRDLPQELRITPRVAPDAGGHLGSLVANHLIRRAAWLAAQETPGIDLYPSATIQAVHAGADAAWLQLRDGPRLEARLLVAADSRFSETRRALGIDADLHDFGKSMLVCRVRHELPHEHAAWEWFGLGQTLALLPLEEHLAGAVVTLPGEQARVLAALDDDAFARELEKRYGGRLGRMELVGSRHVYPLVATWARRFTGPRLALAGDAAVGMHPVTAHGFNLGLASVERLSDLAATALRQGRDLGDPFLLVRYERRHRRGSWPLFQATRAIVGLYTDERAPARWVRGAALRASAALPPFKRVLAAVLTDAGPVDPSPLQRLRSGLQQLRPG
ncbi:5-demethoxyubiquinol-8 5-hydroxylase UbiM [Pseudoxanthomonas daejeonensis]|uniref:5-demethoxyubiquinol-8 5-hydroxylase UbiM n=1 Tax=Pseudoxanthomonas daejeonensis TaxID=266062 RepID=UPI001F546CC5|nr:5-demethoxyubiquinol-8 5-hydroxylase UbiM [Pseudoxanthomonas daejeonensis]UNK57093.1 5-demethoxyubiquinol-8 5-hydroxylase UbiM [Pseudoxanthomonas daejeonensis]